jgi:16S rRNA (cytosine967-C5)-methyltransferase
MMRPAGRAERRAGRGAEPSAGPPGLAARRAALALLEGVLGRGAMLAEQGGSGAERAEARGLADLTLRRLGQVDDLLARFVERPPPGTGRQILRLMATELLFAGTPPHAAVDLAVRLARGGKGKARLAGLVNAVGRRLARDGAAIVSGQDAPALAMPGWLAGALARDWGAEAARAIAGAHLEPAPHDLTLRAPGDADALAVELGGRVLPTGTVRLEARPQITALPGYAAGAWWVQDAAAALPARLIPAPAGKRVLDLCAAPGGKTMQLAAAGARVTALDISEPRMERLRENLGRTGLAAETVTADALEWEAGAAFDSVLLDAPCTATGTIRRHPDLPHRTDGSALAALAALQARLLDRAWGWLAPGGVLVFCTCSLLRAEGEAQADAFLVRVPDAAAFPVTTEEGVPPEFVADGRLRTLPDQWGAFGGLDGFFAARFVRR